MLSDASKKLPETSDLFFEIETAKHHGGWPAWLQLKAQERGMLMAHELHKSMRDHYYYDVRAPGEKVEKPKATMPWDRYREKFFNKPKS